MTDESRGNQPVGMPIDMMMQDTFRVEIRDNMVAEVYIYGQFHETARHLDFLKSLREAARQVHVARVWISSIGGNVTTYFEIKEILKLFQHVITVTTSEACSAGAMVWALGDVKVVAPSATIMIHDVSTGLGAKIEQIDEYIQHSRAIFIEEAKECFGGILTEAEIQHSKFTEVWKSGRWMIENGFAIPFKDMCERENGTHLVEKGTVFKDTQTDETVLVTPTGQALPVFLLSGHEEEGHGTSFAEWQMGIKSAWENLPENMQQVVDSGAEEASEQEIEEVTTIPVTINNPNLKTDQLAGVVDPAALIGWLPPSLVVSVALESRTIRTKISNLSFWGFEGTDVGKLAVVVEENEFGAYLIVAETEDTYIVLDDTYQEQPILKEEAEVLNQL